MQSSYISYDYTKSIERIDQIIQESENSFEEIKGRSDRSKLTYTNGFYVNCTAIFCDIRDSSKLTESHKRPKLAKLYRTYISEVVAILNGDGNCLEIDIIGDGVLGIFEAQYTHQIDGAFSSASRICSLIDILNCKFKKYDIENIKVGLGISFGRALMIKAGYNGSGINEIVWMGDVVNEACHLSSNPINFSNHEIFASNELFQNLNQHNQKLLQFDFLKNCYHGNIINLEMHAWYNKNCQ
jgi:class 3 adenylate cyclase